MMKRAKYIKQFFKSAEGTSAVEFALSAPVLLTILIGGMELLFVFFMNVMLEGGLREAARYGITGRESASARQARIIEILDTHTHGFVDFSTAEVTELVYPDFASINRPEPYTDENGNNKYDVGETYQDINNNNTWDDDMGAPGVGAGDEIVLYKIEYDWPMLTGFLAGLVGQNIRLSAAVAVKNEPF